MAPCSLDFAYALRLLEETIDSKGPLDEASEEEGSPVTEDYSFLEN